MAEAEFVQAFDPVDQLGDNIVDSTLVDRTVGGIDQLLERWSKRLSPYLCRFLLRH